MIEDLVRKVLELERRLDGLVQTERPRWMDWTPTVDQGGAVAVTVLLARYMTFGDLAVVQANLAVTGAGNAGNAVSVQGQPATIQAANTGVAIGIGWVYDATVGSYIGALHVIGATDWRIRAHLETSYVGVDPSFALASGDYIRLQAAYERT